MPGRITVHLDASSAVEMSDGGLKKIRKGTKSCVECRQRKIRCDFSRPTDNACQHCIAHRKTCTPQVYKRQRETQKPKVSSQDRIERLERQLEHIAASVAHERNTTTIVNPIGLTPVSETETISAASPPTHLRLLFDNVTTNTEDTSLHVNRPSERVQVQARLALQHLVPSLEDVLQIFQHAGHWMLLYQEFFPKLSMISSPQESLNKYGILTGPEAHPIEVAAFLVTLALTMQQGLEQTQLNSQSVQDIPLFIRNVVETVQLTIIFNHDFAASRLGIEMMILYLRLQLARGDIRDMWLTLRRMVSIVEYMGLHRLLNQSTTGSEHENESYALIEAVFATDRMASMMFNLPSATSTYSFPTAPIVDKQGNIHARNFMLELTSIVMRVQDFDESIAQGQSYGEVHDKILIADSKLRALAAELPVTWWKISTPTVMKLFPQHFYYYLMVRLHLHAALQNDPHGQYIYGRKKCMEACHKAMERHLELMPLLPAGFFLIRILQMQIFTCATVLVLSLDRDAGEGAVSTAEFERYMLVVDQIIQCLEAESNHSKLEFALEAATALRTLTGWLRAPDSMNSESLTLRVPLLGRVLIGRKHGQAAEEEILNTNMTDDAAMASSTDPTGEGFGQWNPDALPWELELDFDSIFNDPFSTANLLDI